MDDITTLIRAVLAEHGRLSADPAALADSDDLHAAGLSSHATVSLMVAIEDALDLEFPDRLLNRRTFASIASLRDAVASLTVSA